MRHGVRIPPEKRPELARLALAIFEAAATRASALREIEERLAVSEPTARNLVSYGLFLRERFGRNSGVTTPSASH